MKLAKESRKVGRKAFFHFQNNNDFKSHLRYILKPWLCKKVGQDRIEKILTSSQFQALAKGFSIDLKSIRFSSKQTASVAELNRKFLEATAATSINQINNNTDPEVRLFLMCVSSHFDWASNDESSVEFWMFVLISFSAHIKIRSERSPIISFELKHPYNTLKVPQFSKIGHS